VRRMSEIRMSAEDEPIDEGAVIEATGLTAARLQEVEKEVSEIVSLDRPVGGEEDELLEERLADDRGLLPEQEALQLLFREEFEGLLSGLPARQALAVRLHYGLEDGCPYSLSDVGRTMGISRERARQLVKEGTEHITERWGASALEVYRALLRS